ncbi:MAG TPA: hypothetical protein VIF15_03045, partial [Polyangiaceae bacterium]
EGGGPFGSCTGDPHPLGDVHQEGNDLVWESSPMNGSWLDFPGQRRYVLIWPGEFTQSVPYDVRTYVATGQDAQDFPNNFVEGTGQLAEISGVSKLGVTVFNGTCAEYFLRVVAREHIRGITLFGGLEGELRDAETWTWNGAYWTQQIPPAYPLPARSDAAMATLNGTVVLFGGTDGNEPLGDTWTWDGTTWTEQVVTGPSPRFDAAMTSLGGRIVLFGGTDGAGRNDETWTWDGASWMQQAIPGPPARSGAAMTTPATPPPNAHGGFALSEAVLFGGTDGSARLADTWGLTWNDPSQAPVWRKLDVPGPTDEGDAGGTGRTGATMAPYYDGAVLFGGLGGAGALGDTWTLTGAVSPDAIPDTSPAPVVWTWNQQHPASTPSARYGAVSGTLGGHAILFGGSTDRQQPLGETWEWSGGNWALRATGGPAARFLSSMSGP